MTPRTSRPMIRPGTPILVRPGNRVHIGTDPAHSLVIEVGGHASAWAVADLLRSLQGPCSAAELGKRAGTAGLSDADLAEVLRALDDAGPAITIDVGRSTPAIRVHLHGQGPLTDLLATSLPETGITIKKTARRPDHLDVADWEADLVILTDYLVHDPWVVGGLTAERIPHLQVRVRDGVGLLGPLVLPGMSSCLRCADHHRAALDPEWPLLAAQLLRRPGYASSAIIRTTAALAHQQVEELLTSLSRHDRRLPHLYDHVLEVRPDPIRLRRTTWAPHPLCDCRPTIGANTASYILDAERML